MKEIFTITILEDPHTYGKSRCVGFRSSFEKACESIYGNYGDMQESTGKYAVIELYQEGIYCLAYESWWFEWNGDSFVSCEKPEQFNTTINFAF